MSFHDFFYLNHIHYYTTDYYTTALFSSLIPNQKWGDKNI